MTFNGGIDFGWKRFGGVWDDSQTPAFAFGVPAVAPSLVAFPSGTTLRAYAATTGDLFYWSIQFSHEAQTGAVTARPHVHWSMVDNPTAGETLTWAIQYVQTAPSGTFGAAVSTLTANNYTTVGNEQRVHKKTSLGNMSLTMAPSLLVLGVMYASAVPPSENPVVLGFDIHYQKDPLGTFTELV